MSQALYQKYRPKSFDEVIGQDEAILYFTNKPFEVKSYIAAFNTQKVVALLMLRKYDDCKKTLDDVLNLQEEGNMSWFKTMETKILISSLNFFSIPLHI